MSSPPGNSKRRDLDVMKLAMSEFEVLLGDKSHPNDFHVRFFGPKGSPYEGGQWKIHVQLPLSYPYSSPSIGFTNHIYHPNVDFASGSVCLDVINQTWSPMYNLVNVFSQFLPQLLLYPNAADPLNGEAASLYNKDKDLYTKRVRDLVSEYASTDIKMTHSPTLGAQASPSSPTSPTSLIRGVSSASASSSPNSGNSSSSDDDDDPSHVQGISGALEALRGTVTDHTVDDGDLSDLDDEPTKSAGMEVDTDD